MELYAIEGEYFNRDKMIEDYESLVWTERYIDPGDIRLVMEANRANVALLRPGTILGLSTARELMILDTRSIEGGLVTATGKTLETLFEDRRHDALLLFDHPGETLNKIVQNMQERKGGEFAFDRLRLGVPDPGGVANFENIKAGNVHTTLLELAKKYNIGIAVYWVKSELDDGYDLVFSTYMGENLTLDPENPVIFSPDLDNLANVKELLSDVGSKNTAIAYPPKATALAAITEGVQPVTARLEGVYYQGMYRRVAEVNMDFLTKPDQLAGATTEAKRDSLISLMTERAYAALKPKKKIIDGELTAESQYRYYTERNPEGKRTYRLGDQMIIKGHYTDPVVGILSEYIHSADRTGSRSYPGFSTLSEFVRQTDPGEDQ